MSDTQYTPPVPTPPTQSKNSDIIKFAAIFIGFGALIAIAAIAIGGKDSGSTNTPTVTVAPAVAQTAAPTTNKYDDYYQHVLNNSGQAQTKLKADVIELGDLVCGALDKGNCFDAVTSTLASAASGQSDMEYLAAVMFGSIKYICSEYYPAFQAYLGNN